jgi:REP element-mobilizing transposase RayT
MFNNENPSSMPHSLSKVLIHLVFATKRRRPLLNASIRPRLHSYIGGIVANRRGILLEAGSVEDHIHLLIAMPRDITIADLVRDIKAGSSHWLRTTARVPGFEWQGGYSVFSVSQRDRYMIECYLRKQEQHHRKSSFKEELTTLLDEHEVEYDEIYLWDE